SFANSKNEVAVADSLKPLAVPLSISHHILPEFREYERASTVVINAYLQPVMQCYLENLEMRSLAMSKPHGAASASPAQVSAPSFRAKKSGENSIGAENLEVEESRAESLGSASLGVAQRFRAALANPRKVRALAPEGATHPNARIFVMQSSGGITALSTAAREPVRIVLSGPAGGVVGAAA